MYNISEKQIEFILDDIKKRGVGMEDLQLNLLDHICCIIENNLKANGDFEEFYHKTIKEFYKKDLSEIESETISLLTFKNYYIMKKVMIISGALASFILVAGLILKFAHLPGAGVGIVLGIGIMSFIFLPLLAVLKVKEQSETRDKILLVAGVLAGISLSLGTLFKVMFWPGANMLGMSSILILLFGYLPVYFFTGIRNPEKKTNTIVTSMILLTGCGLLLTLVRSPYGSQKVYLQNTKTFINQEALLERERRLYAMEDLKEMPVNLKEEAKQINTLCEEIKTFIIRCETGTERIASDFEKTGNLLGDTRIDKFIMDDKTAADKLQQLKEATEKYNAHISNISAAQDGPTPIASIVLDSDEFRTAEALNGLVQIQLSLLQNQRLISHIN
jgi:hypothetical protein